MKPGGGGVGCGRGEETAPCLGCLRRGGGLPTGPAWPQPVAPPMQRPAAQTAGSKLARTNHDFGRPRWIPGNSEPRNGNAKGLTLPTTLFTVVRYETAYG